MRNILIITLALFLSLNLWAQKVQTRDLEPFDQIEVFGSFDIEILLGDKEGIKLESSTIDLDDVKIRVDGRKLKISIVEKVLENQKQVKAQITYKELRDISASGGAMLIGASEIKGDLLKLFANSGANIDLKVNLNVIDAEVGQGATIAINGTTKKQDVRTTMGGIYSAFSLKSTNTFARANTGGITKVVADSVAELTAGMNGTIRYKGNPLKKTIKKSFGGKVEQADDSEE